MKRKPFILSLCFLAFSWCKAQISANAGVQFLKQFYSAYIGSNSDWHIGNREAAQAAALFQKELLRTSVTREFLLKREGIELQTEADAFYQWQELGPETASTVEVSPLGNNWFRVCFWWGTEEKRRDPPKELSVCLTTVHDSLRIRYVTPLWNGALYGDSLFYECPLPVRIDNRSPEAFLQSFYKAYTMGYTALQVDSDAYIAALRKKYLLPEAMDAMQKWEELLMSDGRSGYDLLIDGFVFDRLWEKDLKFIPQAEELSYKLSCPWTSTHAGTTYIILKLVCQGSSYRIERIVTGFDEHAARIAVFVE